MTLLFEKGHVFIGPDGQGYELTRDIPKDEVMTATDFREFGGAPKTGPNMMLPEWMTDYLKDYVP